ncbi:zinc metalloproteinase nas-4 [Contarinia nasturtii]|uniref:zinc metalloproteinase nas-4 n=1 Tax=Contarinia nasturtii TaxID=265458 RepID=UPI0012D43140|nr:zinc metalloproteinase nas-4 [Contarinia nasturtii]
MLNHLVCLFVLSASVGASDSSLPKDYFENEFTLGDERQNDRNAMKSSTNKWPNGIVPYRFDDGYTEKDRAAILNAMEVFRKKTCIKFHFKRTTDTYHIRFKKSNSGCGTLVGYKANQSEPIDIYLSENCLKLSGAIQHELLHVLGLWHEQSRPDRDEYVDIIWDNIEPNHRHNFAKKDNDLVETFNLPYDYDSLMHYPKNAFAKRGTNYTIVAKHNTSRKLGQINSPSEYDVEKIRRMYNCQ